MYVLKKEIEILETIIKFMPTFYVHINSALHKCTYNGYRFNENQIKVMMVLRLFPGISPTELSQGLNIQKGSLTTIIKSLVEMSYLEKTKDKQDERKYYLSLTAKGEKFIAFKDKDNITKFEKLFEDISEEECKKIVEGFSCITNYLKAKEERRLIWENLL